MKSYIRVYMYTYMCIRMHACCQKLNGLQNNLYFSLLHFNMKCNIFYKTFIFQYPHFNIFMYTIIKLIDWYK